MDNNSNHPPVRGGFRGRGPYRGFDMRGRGRGRGMGRGGPMGGRGMPPMMRGRGFMRGPRGMGLGPRGMGPPRSSRGMGRSQGPGGPPGTNDEDAAPRCLTTVSTFAGSNNTAAPEDGSPIQTTTSAGSARGGFPRGRFMRGRGSFGGPGAPNNTTIPGTGPDPKPFNRSDGGKPRGYMGRGGFRGGFSRPMRGSNLLTPQGNGNVAPVPSLKRNGPGGMPGPKRGRFDSGPPARGFAPKPNYAQSNPSHMNQYSQPQAAPNHQGYSVHDGNHQQGMDPYAQSYQQAPPQNYSNNGYAQTGYTDPNVQSTGYAQTTGYEQHYPDYNNSNTYGTQDNRYQYNNTQDYQSGGYGTTTDGYNAAPQDPYQQSSYDDRTYNTSYDTTAYNQGSYQNHATGYY
ncbi:collagen alpha chain [Phlebotomus argentipes]|uniref:collagen alpha chain n=1 Tax=Phlebotomus argentipes TaxID=94469 RepID=UPI002892D5AB|nr:collagen alpha chain [Phlebotomus argentipes]